MTQTALNTPINAQRIDGHVVITGPDGINTAMTPQAARATLENLQRALDGGGQTSETYQKPLG
jgi:hypothetical protein